MTADRTGTDLRAVLGGAPVGRDVVRVGGPDAPGYLQGQVSQDVDSLDVGSTARTFVLQPNGKVDAWARVTRTGDEEFVLDVDHGGEALVARLRRFLLRTRADVDRLDWHCVALRGPGASEVGLGATNADLSIPAGWPGIDGVCLLGPTADLPIGVVAVGSADIEALRIEAGVPATGRELTERTIPAEAGQWIIDSSVSFTKGCFTGQELVARIDSRGGNVPRHLRGVIVEGTDVPPAGATIEVGGDRVGTITSAGWSTTLAAPIALGYVGRAVVPPARATLTSPGGERWSAEVRALPLVGPD